MRQALNKIMLPLLTAALLSGCVYRQDILQGNVLLDRDIEKLELGMSREQVKFILGTPMVADPYHPDRWDYLLYVDSMKEERDRYRHMVMYFGADGLERIEKRGGFDDESMASEVPKAGFEEETEENPTTE
ncbi:MAG: outer membrane protein assembly factor BamE [Gammaproteobacteria bacterium]|nr:outer membrane protein assembly factor BamE [Gammaproteobacteria bacterium]